MQINSIFKLHFLLKSNINRSGNKLFSRTIFKKRNILQQLQYASDTPTIIMKSQPRRAFLPTRPYTWNYTHEIGIQLLKLLVQTGEYHMAEPISADVIMARLVRSRAMITAPKNVFHTNLLHLAWLQIRLFCAKLGDPAIQNAACFIAIRTQPNWMN